MQQLKLVGDRHRRQQVVGLSDVAAVGGGWWRRECGSSVWQRHECG
jgi:hypothetical protein